MKFVTLKNGSRDGSLCLVDRQLTRICSVSDISPTLQHAIEHWDACLAKFKARYDALNAGDIKDTQPYDPKQLLAPLPRAYQWADGSAYVHHIELVRKARGAEMPENFWTDPLMYQGGSDTMLPPTAPIHVGDAAWGVDFEAEVAVILKDVPYGVTPDRAGHYIALVMLVNDVSLRNLIPEELAKGFGFFQSKPATALSPVAVTPDELGDAWDGKKLHLPLLSYLNGVPFGRPNAGVDMTFDFPTLIAHAAKTRFLAAGTIIGSGTVSNRDRSTGSSCIVERRVIEILDQGKAITPFMQYGDHIHIEMVDAEGQSIFGAIDQTVVRPEPEMHSPSY